MWQQWQKQMQWKYYQPTFLWFWYVSNHINIQYDLLIFPIPKFHHPEHFLQPTLWFTCLALFLNTISTSLSYLCHFQLPGRTKVLYFRSQKCCVFWTNHKKERHKNHLNHNDVIFTILTWCVTAAVFSLTPIKYLIKRTGTSWVDWRKKDCFFFDFCNSGKGWFEARTIWVMELTNWYYTVMIVLNIYSGLVQYVECIYIYTYANAVLVGGWTNPFEKYARQIGSSPQGSGWK